MKIENIVGIIVFCVSAPVLALMLLKWLLINSPGIIGTLCNIFEVRQLILLAAFPLSLLALLIALGIDSAING